MSRSCICRGDGIGRHGRLKTCWRFAPPCGFESHPRHHVINERVSDER